MAFVLRFIAVALPLWLAASASVGEQHRPIDGQRLLIRASAAPAAGRFIAESGRVESLAAEQFPDPRVVGATLEVSGSGAHADHWGPIDLPPGGWRGIGSPAGSGGFRFDDPERRVTVILRSDLRGGRIRIRAAGSAFAYRLDGPQEEILVRLAMGTAVFCASYGPGSLRPGNGTVLVARRSMRPDLCVPPRCGNGLEDPGEECDDGNFLPRDGCSPTCRRERSDDPCAGVPLGSSERLGVELVAGGRDRPVYMASPPGDRDRLWIVEQPGRIRVVHDGVLLDTPVLDIVARVSCCGERGLLSVAFDPDYGENRRFFVNYTDRGGATVVSRFHTGPEPDRADPDAEQVLLRIPQDFPNHNGGQLAFGPDGYLYIGMGDGGSGGDPRERAQDGESLLGKLLRLDVAIEAEPYHAVPASNPRASEGAPLGLIWASGLRNPWRFGFDRSTGDLYVADVGQSAWEEINVQRAASSGGENYGWDIFEGSACFDPLPHFPSCPEPRDGFVFPVHEYRNPSVGCSVTGGYVYRGCRMPDLHGTYFYADYCQPFVRTFQFVDGIATNHGDRSAEFVAAAATLGAISSFGEDARGELYFATLNGGNVYRIVPAP